MNKEERAKRREERKKYSVIDWKVIGILTVLIIVGVFIIGNM